MTLSVISWYITMTQDTALPKSYHFNWCQIWIVKIVQRLKESTIKIKTKATLNSEVFVVGKNLEDQIFIRILENSIYMNYQL